MTTKGLVAHAGKVLQKHIPTLPVPYWIGMMGGYAFDLLSKISGKKLAISSVRVKKFCAVTQFDASKALAAGFRAPYSLQEGLGRTLGYEFGEEVDTGKS
jgi:hypothetical protein